MPVEEQIKVSIIGDASSMEDAAQQSSSAADKISESLGRAGKAAEETAKTYRQFVSDRMGSYMKEFGGHGPAIRKIAEEWGEYKKGLVQLGPATNQAATGLTQITRNSGAAAQSMINLSRIAQDAPYGFIGIANNLNPMMESFQRLQVEAGGTQAALKGMLGALAGPAGIGLALGVVSSLLVTFGKDIFGAGKETEDAGHKFEYFTDRINDVKSALEDVNSEITFLGKLGSINIKINGLKESLDLQGQVVDIAQKVAAAQKSYEDYGDTVIEIQSKLNASDKKGNLLITGKDRDELEGELKKATDAQRKANEDVIKLQQDRVVAERTVALEKKKEAEDEAKDRDEEHKKALAALKKRNRELLEEEKRAAKERHDLLASLRTGSIAFDSPTDFFKNLNKEEAQRSNPDYEKYLKNQFSNIQIPARINIVPQSTPILKPSDLNIINGLALSAAVSAEINKALQDIEVSGFAALGDAIGKAITGGNIGEVFAGLGQQLGGIISQLGEQLIKLGVTMQAAKLALADIFTNPFATIGIGVALTALGSAFQSALRVPHMAEGGIIPPGYNGDKFPAMLNSGEAVIPLDKIGSILGNVGGGGPQVIVIGQRLRGRDAVLQQMREGKSQRRAV